jgi:aldehyde:ferredoxin oxidoreductase
MATPGFAGKILLVNLTDRQIRSLDSAGYEAYGGGHGTAAAIFWDLCVAPGDWDLQDAFDPRNAVILMTGPLSGTGLPFAARTSVSGLSPQSWPANWFCHSNFGGAFAGMLKMAGWDGVVVVGKAESPVYINIVNDKVTLEDAKSLWGLTTWETQERIWQRTPARYGTEWQQFGDGYSLQWPAIVTIGPAGENMTRVASLIHGGGSGAGQGGFGGVFGSKNLKAISVIGTGSIQVADPKQLRATREWWETTWPRFGGLMRAQPGVVGANCMACSRSCHNRNQVYGADSDNCAEATWYALAPPYKRTPTDVQWKSTDLAQKYGLNAMETCFMGPMSFKVPADFPIQPELPAYTALGWYLRKMYDLGVVGPGKKVDTYPLPMEHYDRVEFAEVYAMAISKRIGIGDLLAEGTVRFAEKLGRLPDDFNTILRTTAWGYQNHWSMPGVEWAYGNLMDARDINNHDMGRRSRQQKFTCEQYVNILADRTKPVREPLWFDYSWQGERAYKTGIYSDYKAQWVAWRQHYATYYKESALYCDWGFFNLFNQAHPEGKGYTPDAEPKFLNAVTGRSHTFEDGMEIGRRAWNMKRAIFVMQGRHRDQEKFPGHYYRPGASYNPGEGADLPVFDGSKWEWADCRELYFEDKGVERWKTAFYKTEGWDPATGYPTLKTLESLGMKHVADVLKSRNRLGSA